MSFSSNFENNPFNPFFLDKLPLLVCVETEAEKLERLQLVTKVYLENQFITDKCLNEKGVFIDEFESMSTAWILRDKAGQHLCSFRLVTGELKSLPISHLRLKLSGCIHYGSEVTQLVINQNVAKDYPTVLRRYLMLYMVYLAALVTSKQESPYLFAVVNESFYLKLDNVLGRAKVRAGPSQVINIEPYLDKEPLSPIVANSHRVIRVITQKLLAEVPIQGVEACRV